MRWILLAVWVTGCSSATSTPRISTADAALRAYLAERSVESGSPIRITRSRGHFGTTTVHAVVEGAYPGADMAQGVEFRDVHYGRLGADITELISVIGWSEVALHPAELAQVATLGWFWQIAPVGDTARIERAEDTLSLRFEARSILGDGDWRVEVDVPTRGDARYSKIPREAQPSPGAATALSQALSSGDAMAISSAVRSLKGSHEPARFELLAKVTTLGNEPLAVAALEVIGSSPAAIRALRSEWSKLTGAELAGLQEIAAEILGEDAVRQLKD